MGLRVEESSEFYLNGKQESNYFDMLYEFSRTFVLLNKRASTGISPRVLQKKISGLAPAFIALCGSGLAEAGSGQGQPEPKREHVPEKSKEELAEKPKPRTALNSNLRVRNDWGVCPVCGAKCIKVNRHTILVNFPMFCKRCKTEHVVTWKYDPAKVQTSSTERAALKLAR